MENDFTYYAFISYSHKDEAWAKWIQEAIERYRLPAIIRKEVKKPLPKKIQPVFLDQTDLGVGKLVDNLHQELEKSRFLIVVCSPNSARANAEGRHFIEEEVVHFCNLGREKQIIPVIVEGTPQEAFCPKLKELDLLALDATKESKARILNDIVATILGLRRDDLWNRERRRQRQQRIRRAILATAVGFMAAIAGLFAWDSNRTVKNYYADYVDSFGLPEGIFPLKKTDLAHRHIHYRFEYKGFQHGKSPHADSADWCIWNMFGFRRRLVRVVQANSRGYPRKWDHIGDAWNYTEYSNRPQIQDFKYDSDSRLHEIRCGRYNGEGQEPHLEKRIELSNEGAVNDLLEFFSNDGRLGFAYDDTSITSRDYFGFFGASKSEITKHLVKRDGGGRVTQRLFLNNSGAKVSDGDGVCGFSYAHDDLGRQTAQWYLVRAGDGFDRCANKNGVAGLVYTYLGHNLKKAEYIDIYGSPLLGRQGCMGYEDSFDEFDNNTMTLLLGADGRPKRLMDGSAGVHMEYDKRGDMVKRLDVDIDGKPHVHGVWEHMEYDERGNMTKESYYSNIDGKLIERCGFAERHMEYDERGNVTKESYYDIDGKPTRRYWDDYAEVRMAYDGRGYKTRESYYDIDGKPTLGKDGVAEVRMEYDGLGNKTRESYFGIDGKPTGGKEGIAEICTEYDGRGNTKLKSYFGIDGKPTGNVVRWEYDERGNRTRELCFGVDGKPTRNEVRWEYDERGNVTRESYYDIDGKPTWGMHGDAEVRMEYNEHGNVTRESYYDIDGSPIGGKEGIAEIRTEYDRCGNKTRESYFGVDGKPTLGKDGVAEVRMKYDGRGNTMRMAYFGVDGKPMLGKRGVACGEAEYNRRGQITRMAYFGVDGKPTLGKDGVAEVRIEYDGFGNTTRESYFGIDGKPTGGKEGIAEIRTEYDGRGNVTHTLFFGVDGKPAGDPNGISEVRIEYDDRGNVKRRLCYDVNGKLLMPNKNETTD